MSRRVSLALLGLTAVVVATTLAACGSSDSGGSAADVDRTGASAAVTADATVAALLPAAVKNNGELVVGTEAQYPPFEFYESDNKTITGLDADLAGDIAGLADHQALGLQRAFELAVHRGAARHHHVAFEFHAAADEDRAFGAGIRLVVHRKPLP